MGFDLASLLGQHGEDGARLHTEYLNPQVPRLMRTVGFDRVYERGSGARLVDREGREYLDFLSGFGVFGLGRNHPAVREALRQVLDAPLADMVQFDTPVLPGLLARELVARAPGLSRVYFTNSGAEAVEAALKFARRATGRGRILFWDHAYHGLTAGSLSVNGSRDFRRGFGPLLPDTRVPVGDLGALRRQLRRGDVAGLLVEPIQGKGVYVPPPGFLAEARALLHAHGALLICDEVQTGIGRTGRFLAYEHEGVEPDIATVAKALSGGFIPVGATLTKDWIFQRVYSSLERVFVHASTFAGNAMAMAAGLATLAVIDEEGLVENAERMGRLLIDGLTALRERYDLITDIRGRGLMIGIEFGRPPINLGSLRRVASWDVLRLVRRGLFAQLIVQPLFSDHRVLTQVAADRTPVIKLLPPLTIGQGDVDEFLTAFEEVMRRAHRGAVLGDLGRSVIGQAIQR
jgi:ornithine--oxo-acid transaminase